MVASNLAAIISEIWRNLGKATDRPGPEEVILGHRNIRVLGEVKEQELGRYQSKITTGDYTQDSDPLTSAYGMSSFAGGMGNMFLKEGVDDETYWTATMETRWPHLLTNLRKTWDYDGDDDYTTAKAVGDYPASAPAFYAAFDTTLKRWDDVNGEFDDVDTLPASPTGPGMEINEKLFIPMGNDGIAVWDGSTLETTDHADIHALKFTIYDNRLACITTEGHLRIMRLDETWEGLVDAQKLPSGFQPRNIVTFIDQQQNPTIHVITNKGIFAYSRNDMTLIQTHLQYPPHPYQGMGATVFRGDSIYVSVGIGIHGYNGNTITAMGPDNRYGLPDNLRGYITDLHQEYNGLLALVQGAPAEGDEDEPFVLTPPTYQDDEPYFPEVNTMSTLLRWNQQGWHPVWTSETAGGTPTNIYVSVADGEYRLWWGYSGKMYRQDLPIGFHNPKVGMQIGEDSFQERGHLLTGWFDADMKAFKKLGAHVELAIEDVFEDNSPLGTVTIRYQVDYDPTWYTLGQADAVGRFVFPFRNIERVDGSLFSVGQLFNRIRFRIESVSLTETITPAIEAVLFKFLKIPFTQKSWTFTVDLASNQGYKQQENQELKEYLQELVAAQMFTRFVHRDQEYRVRVAQTNGADWPGTDNRSKLTMSVIEVKVPDEDEVS